MHTKMKGLKLVALPGTYCVCRLNPSQKIPSKRDGFWSVTRTLEEVSLVCEEAVVPRGSKCESGWRCLKVAGPLDFALTGILASLTQPLAKQRIPVFAISTYDTDYLFIKRADWKSALETLGKKGHSIVRPPKK